MFSIWLVLNMVSLPENIQVIKEYQNPETVSEESIINPYSIDFSADGRLYMADRNNHRILVWGADGRFLHAFGKNGEGPGEIAWPLCIAVSGREVWVYDGTRRFHRFDLDGKFINALKVSTHYPRVFAPIDEKRALLGSRLINGETGNHTMEFNLIDIETRQFTLVKSWENNTILRVHDNNDVRWKAFGDDIDVQKGENGETYFGFSQDPNIYQYHDDGRLESVVKLRVPKIKINDQDREYLANMSFPSNNGGRFTYADLPNWRWDFSQTKAPYTHFLIKGDRALLVLTPLGSISGVGAGYYEASYFIVNRKTGKPIQKGTYTFSQDSVVLFKRGRIIAFVLDEEGEYAVKELKIEGF